jgi:hypothetical protein
MDAQAAQDERGRCMRQNRVVLIPRRCPDAGSSSPLMTASDGRYKARYTGERGMSLKDIAQGVPDISACLWFLTRVLSTLHTRRVRSWHRHSL